MLIVLTTPRFCGVLCFSVFLSLLSCRLENVQYPYHLYISPSTRPGHNGPERPFQCPTCGVRFTRIQNLKQHMLIHSGESKSLSSYLTFRIISSPRKCLVRFWPQFPFRAVFESNLFKGNKNEVFFNVICLTRFLCRYCGFL